MALDNYEKEIAKKNPKMKETLEFLDKINDPSKWVYGSELRDAMLLNEASTHSRFAHLARKAFVHYAGERYNPHTISISNEAHIRELIKLIIEYKIESRKGYDWELIDNFLMRSIYLILDLELPSDFVSIERQVLPEFRSPFHDLEIDINN